MICCVSNVRIHWLALNVNNRSNNTLTRLEVIKVVIVSNM